MTRRNLWMTPFAALAAWLLPKPVRTGGQSQAFRDWRSGLLGMPTVEDEYRLEELEAAKRTLRKLGVSLPGDPGYLVRLERATRPRLPLQAPSQHTDATSQSLHRPPSGPGTWLALRDLAEPEMPGRGQQLKSCAESTARRTHQAPATRSWPSGIHGVSFPYVQWPPVFS